MMQAYLSNKETVISIFQPFNMRYCDHVMICHGHQLVINSWKATNACAKKPVQCLTGIAQVVRVPSVLDPALSK